MSYFEVMYQLLGFSVWSEQKVVELNKSFTGGDYGSFLRFNLKERRKDGSIFQSAPRLVPNHVRFKADFNMKPRSGYR